MINRFLFAFAMLVIFSSTAFSDVIENDASLIHWFDNQYLFELTKSVPDGGGYVAFSIEDLGDGDFQVAYQGIAELIAGFEAVDGVVFDTNYVVNNVPLSINDNSVNNGIVSLDIGESFFFAYWDDRSITEFYEGNIIGPDFQDNFGWAEIVRTDSGLELLGSATAINHGIVVGTTIQVPEPSSVLLGTIVGLAFTFRRSRCCTGSL